MQFDSFDLVGDKRNESLVSRYRRKKNTIGTPDVRLIKRYRVVQIEIQSKQIVCPPPWFQNNGEQFLVAVNVKMTVQELDDDSFFLHTYSNFCTAYGRCLMNLIPVIHFFVSTFWACIFVLINKYNDSRSP